MRRSEEEIQLVRDWLAFAKENLLAAKALASEDFAPFHTVCFLSQASAEKHLKAFLIWHGWSLKKTHDLSELLKYCSDYDASLVQLAPECQLLNDYATEGRYPGDLPFESIGKQDAKEAVEAAEKIEALVQERISISSNHNL